MLVTEKWFVPFLSTKSEKLSFHLYSGPLKNLTQLSEAEEVKFMVIVSAVPFTKGQVASLARSPEGALLDPLLGQPLEPFFRLTLADIGSWEPTRRMLWEHERVWRADAPGGDTGLHFILQAHIDGVGYSEPMIV